MTDRLKFSDALIVPDEDERTVEVIFKWDGAEGVGGHMIRLEPQEAEKMARAVLELLRQRDQPRPIIVCGSRGLTDIAEVERAMEAARSLGYVPSRIITGGQTTLDEFGKVVGGADWLAVQWAQRLEIPVQVMPADWAKTGEPGAVVRRGRYGEYDAAAGPRRNRKMAEVAAAEGGACVAVWDGQSKGTRSMIGLARELHLPVYVHRYAPTPANTWERS